MKKTKIMLTLDAGHYAEMKRIKDEKGMPVQFQIRKAIALYLKNEKKYPEVME